MLELSTKPLQRLIGTDEGGCYRQTGGGGCYKQTDLCVGRLRLQKYSKGFRYCRIRFLAQAYSIQNRNQDETVPMRLFQRGRLKEEAKITQQPLHDSLTEIGDACTLSKFSADIKEPSQSWKMCLSSQKAPFLITCFDMSSNSY